MKKFLQACIGAAIVLFATGFLIRSINSAEAAPKSIKPVSAVDDYPFEGVGISDGFAYYIIKEQGVFYKLKKIALNKATDY